MKPSKQLDQFFLADESQTPAEGYCGRRRIQAWSRYLRLPSCECIRGIRGESVVALQELFENKRSHKRIDVIALQA